MEEKKTKKMTKVEAFAYLEGTKVACDNRSEAVQRKLFEVGIRWLSGTADVKDYASLLLIDIDGMTYCDTRDYFDLNDYEEISADDILSIEIVEEKKEESENIHNDLEKWIEIVRNNLCRNGWSFIISESGSALIRGDLVKEKRIKE